MAYTAVERLGGAKVYPSVDREGMGVYYDAAQHSDTVKDMRMRKMKKVRLPHIAIEDNEMPPHLDTYMKQLPTRFQFDDGIIIRKGMALEVYDLKEPTVIPPGPTGSLRAYTVTNGDVNSTGEHAPSYTRTMTHMCPAALATPLLTPGPGGATLLVTTCPIAPVAREPGGQAGTSIYVVPRQKAGERLVIVELQLDTVAQSVVVTLVGGDRARENCKSKG